MLLYYFIDLEANYNSNIISKEIVENSDDEEYRDESSFKGFSPPRVSNVIRPRLLYISTPSSSSPSPTVYNILRVASRVPSILEFGSERPPDTPRVALEPNSPISLYSIPLIDLLRR